MCGIAGVVASSSSSLSSHELRALAEAMASSLHHRGPDGQGVWMDPSLPIAISHRRLSIIDLSSAGNQPMVSADGRLVLSYNGEVYNFAELRRELEPLGVAFRGASDTEVILAAMSAWGVEQAVKRMDGMFAFAVWDRSERVLHLARDRIGEKPLYYGWAGGVFLFASELKAFSRYRGFSADIDRDALTLFLRNKYIPTPFSIFRGVSKLPPASILSMPVLEGPSQRGRLTRYWSAQETATSAGAEPFEGSVEDAIDRLDDLLGTAVASRMVADVPLGAFLSGGVDSSAVVSMMRAKSGQPVQTFTIGSDIRGWDESVSASAVAHHLRTEHTALRVTGEEALDVVPRLAELYDEPFADSSQIPTLLVSALARRSVTVALSGDGGDELFGGYNRHLYVARLARAGRWIPPVGRRLIARTLRAIPPRAIDRSVALGSRVFPGAVRLRQAGDKVTKLSWGLEADGPDAVYRQLVSHWKEPARLVLGGTEANARSLDGLGLDPAARIMVLDAETYLPDDILTKVDRASMSTSLEVRVPFLEPNLMRFAWTLPPDLRFRDGQSKWLLRRVLDRYLPRHLIDRPKSGFGVPLHEWLRGPLRPWAEELLSERRLRREGFFEPRLIREAWKDHLSGRRNRQYELWDVLMFQAWLEAQNRARVEAHS
jgi:asparagine synthase (glutamine-hydrolysing)